MHTAFEDSFTYHGQRLGDFAFILCAFCILLISRYIQYRYNNIYVFTV